jgi:hypothetical protein
MHDDGFNPRVLKLLAWTGPLFTLMWLSGAGPTTGWIYLPPPSAADSAAQTLTDYQQNPLLMRLGCLIMITSSIFYTTWGMLVSILTRKIEKDYPIFFFIQVVSLAACVVVVLLIGYFWGAASWRAGETLPEVTQALNDIGWLGVLFTGAPFALYQWALAATIFLDTSERPVYPRWSAFFSLFVSFFMIEAGLLLFFKTGPFSQNGLFVFYMPMFVFFVWILTYSWLSIRAINLEAAARERASASSASRIPSSAPRPSASAA